jgi:hypothetical protein
MTTPDTTRATSSPEPDPAPELPNLAEPRATGALAIVEHVEHLVEQAERLEAHAANRRTRAAASGRELARGYRELAAGLLRTAIAPTGATDPQLALAARIEAGLR